MICTLFVQGPAGKFRKKRGLASLDGKGFNPQRRLPPFRRAGESDRLNGGAINFSNPCASGTPGDLVPSPGAAGAEREIVRYKIPGGWLEYFNHLPAQL